ncbi:unnamed protein product [Prorocentrum cordatum]|uniref:Uncharacterized protein n=1 Tax=Prorocentrum cordatum TaxID=2364126 RepID=A0ABN9V4W4_9DINO|nr:unnamed protein product [Polarella glacialis]
MSSLPKASSLKRRKLQMDAISAEQDLWEAKIRMAQDSRAQQDTLLVEVAETAQEETKLNSDIERKTDLPKRLSPNRRQAEKLEQICKDKEGQVAVLQGQLDACPGSPGELGLDGAPAAAERAQQRRRAPPDQGEAADPPRRRPWAPPERPAVGGAAERAAAPAAGRGGTADGAGGRDWAVRFLELPWVRAARGAPEGAPRERAAAPAAGRGGAADGAGDCDWAVRLLQLPWAQAARGAQVAEKSVDQDARIAELEWRLARSAQELLKGPAVVKEMFAETFGTTPEDQGKLGQPVLWPVPSFQVFVAHRSTFAGTLLHGQYTKGSATFRSDSITTISVLKDLITREATAKKIQLKIDVEVKDETFPRFLELIHPKLEFQHSLTQQVRMVEPLREVQLQEGDVKFLAPELQQVLERGTEIQQQFELQPRRLAFLHSLVASAYRHKWRLRGYQSVEHRMNELQKLLDDYNVEQIAAFFDEPVD